MIRDIQEAFSRLVSVFRRRTLDQDFDEEFASHVDLLTGQNKRRGLDQDEARRQAILQMGGLNATRDLHRDVRGLPWFERFLDAFRGFARDMVHAARSLAKTRTFTFVCVASLGLGMATVVAIPYVFQALTMPPPGVNTDGLVELLMTPRGPLRVQVGDWASEMWSYPDFAELRDAYTGMTMTGWAFGKSETTVQTPTGVEAVTVPTMFVSANYFNTVGVTLARGPGFNEAVDDALTAEPVVIVGYDFWQDRLGSDPDIVGKTLTLDGIQHVVAGIAPDQYSFHLSAEDSPGSRLFVPLERHPRLRADKSLRVNREIDWLRIHGRLSPGVNIAQANAAVSLTMSRLAELHPTSNEFKAASVEPYFSLGARERWEFMALKSLLLGMTGMVLLVVCLNVSGMMHVRGALRERELSIRQAIGATRGRLFRYLLSEAIMLAGLGGALGAVVLFNAPAMFYWWQGQPIPLQLQEAFRPDLPIVAICLGLCLATSLVFGLLPAIRFSRPVLISALKDDAGGGGRRVGRIQRLAAAVQVGIAVPFLVIGGMLVNQARTTATADLGFEPEGLAAVQLDLDAKSGAKDVGFFLRNAWNNLERASGVAAVTVADSLPLDFQRRITRVSRPRDGKNVSDVVEAHVTRVAEGYLNTMDIPLLRGRGITAEDAPGAELVTVISKPLADQFFLNAEAIGERLTFAIEGNAPQVFTIVGVTGDFVTSQMSTPRAQLLVPLTQHPASNVFLVARSTAGEQPMTLTAALENAIRGLDPDFSRASIVTGDQLRRRSIRSFLQESAIAGSSGGLVLTLSALGIYGVVGFMVTTRTREIAVRVALGATRRHVLGMILSDVVKLIMPGVAGGLLVAIALVRMEWGPLSGMEFLAYGFGAVAATAVALMASLLPVRRAVSVQPMAAMRSE